MFAGYVVTFWNHETCKIETDRFETVEEVLARGFDDLPWPEEIMEDLYEVYGDTVRLITDLEGTVLLDRRTSSDTFSD